MMQLKFNRKIRNFRDFHQESINSLPDISINSPNKLADRSFIFFFLSSLYTTSSFRFL
jgi:hypothetical protein